jgi:hypothetical protein
MGNLKAASLNLKYQRGSDGDWKQLNFSNEKKVSLLA